MTLDDLLAEVRKLHPSSLTAQVEVESGEVDCLAVHGVRYEGGRVIVTCEEIPYEDIEDNQGGEDKDDE